MRDMTGQKIYKIALISLLIICLALILGGVCAVTIATDAVTMYADVQVAHAISDISNDNSGALSTVQSECNYATADNGTETYATAQSDSTETYATVQSDSKKIVSGTIQPVTKVYGDNDPTITIKDGADVWTLPSSVFSRVSGEDVGTYMISLDQTKALTEGFDCSAVDLSQPVYLTITKREIKIKANDNSKVYLNSDPALSYSFISGVMQGSDRLNVVVTRESGENAGTYTITATQSSNQHINKNYNITSDNGVFTIHKYKVNLKTIDQQKQYGDSLTVYVDVTSDTDFNGIIEATVKSSVSTFKLGKQKLDINVVVKTKIGFVIENGVNNLDITKEIGWLTVSEKDIKIRANDKYVDYGESEDGLLYFDTNSSQKPIEGHRFLSNELARLYPNKKTVGTYPLHKGDLKIVDTNGDDVSEFYNIIIHNYSDVTPALSIRPKEVEIEFRDNIFAYFGDGEFDFAEYDDILNDQLCYGETGSFERLNLENKNVGAYDIALNCDFDLDNYEIKYFQNSDKGTYKILPRPITVKIVGFEKQYGTEFDPMPKFVLVSGNLCGGDSIENIEILTDRETGEEIGEYHVDFVSEMSGNYDVTLVEAVFTITPKELSVQGFIVASKVYDGSAEADLFGENIRLIGLLGDDQLTFNTDYYAQFSSIDPADNIKVELKNFILSGEKVGNYTLVSPDLRANITPKILNFGDDDFEFTADKFTVIKNGGKLDIDTVVSDSRTGFDDDFGSFKSLSCVLAKYDFSVTNNGVEQEIGEKYTLKIKLPKQYRNIYKLGFSYADSNGNIKMLASERDGRYVTVKFDHLISDFYLIAEDNSWIVVTAETLGGISAVLALMFGIYFAVRLTAKKTKKNQDPDDDSDQNNDDLGQSDDDLSQNNDDDQNDDYAEQYEDNLSQREEETDQSDAVTDQVDVGLELEVLDNEQAPLIDNGNVEANDYADNSSVPIDGSVDADQRDNDLNMLEALDDDTPMFVMTETGSASVQLDIENISADAVEDTNLSDQVELSQSDDSISVAEIDGQSDSNIDVNVDEQIDNNSDKVVDVDSDKDSNSDIDKEPIKVADTDKESKPVKKRAKSKSTKTVKKSEKDLDSKSDEQNNG